MLSFLKNFYDKIILLVLLIIFVALLIFQVFVIKKVQDFRLGEIIGRPEPIADYKKIDFSGDAYMIDNVFMTDATWKPIGKRSISSRNENYTDLLAPYQLSLCYNCASFIPRSAIPTSSKASDGKCPMCNAALPPVEIKTTIIDSLVPAEYLEALGLDPADQNAPYLDLDGDGFNVLEEYNAKTEERNPKSHPPFALKLDVENIKSPRIGMFIKNITYSGPDKNKWEIQLDVDKKRGNSIFTDTEWVRIGNTVSVASADGSHVTPYKIIDIDKRIQSEPDKSLGNALVEKDNTVVVFERLDDSGEKITGMIKTEILDNRESASLHFRITDTVFERFIGESFALGDNRTGIEQYVVVSISKATRTVVVENIGTQAKYTLAASPDYGMRTGTPRPATPSPQPRRTVTPAPSSATKSSTSSSSSTTNRSTSSSSSSSKGATPRGLQDIMKSREKAK